VHMQSATEMCIKTNRSAVTTGTAWTGLRFTHSDSDMLSTRVPLESSSSPDTEMGMESPPPFSSRCCASDPSFSSFSSDDPPLSIRTGILARTGFNVLGKRRARGDPKPSRRGRRPSPETAWLPSHFPSTPRHSASTRMTRAATRNTRAIPFPFPALPLLCKIWVEFLRACFPPRGKELRMERVPFDDFGVLPGTH
jgi:hypothetical protein